MHRFPHHNNATIVFPYCILYTGLICLSFLVWKAPAYSSPSKPSNLATALSKLRGEVEQLSVQIDEKRREMRSQLRSLSMRKSSLELSLQKAKLQLRQWVQRQRKQQKKVQASGQAEATLRPVVLQSIQAIRSVVTQGLPFRVQERLKVLDQLSRQLKGKIIRPLKACSRLWQFVDDEMRLGRENGLYSQIISLNGKKQLVEVARLGMVMLFFKTRNEKYGSATQVGQSWKFSLLPSPEEQKQVKALFDALKQKIRAGFFTLPNRLPKR